MSRYLREEEFHDIVKSFSDIFLSASPTAERTQIMLAALLALDPILDEQMSRVEAHINTMQESFNAAIAEREWIQSIHTQTMKAKH